MVKYTLIITSLILLISLQMISAINCSPTGCDYNGICYSYGDIISDVSPSIYCDANGSFVTQKNFNAICSNNFECLSDACLSDKCANLSSLLQDYTAFYENFTYLSAGPCSSTPGCLNLSSLTNAHNLSNLCSGAEIEFKCFECDDDYSWNGSSCAKMNCSSTPGCLNLSSLTNAQKLNRVCSNNYNCFSCNSGYSWNSSSSYCYSNPVDDNTGGTSGYTVVITNSQLEDGFTGTLARGWSYKIYFSNDYYFILVTSLSTSQMTLRITPRTKVLTFNIGGERKIDLNDDGFYDLSIKLNSIQNQRASVTLKKINEPVVSGGSPGTTQNGSQNGSDAANLTSGNTDDSQDNLVTIIVYAIIGIIILLLIIGGILFYRSRKKLQATQ